MAQISRCTFLELLAAIAVYVGLELAVHVSNRRGWRHNHTYLASALNSKMTSHVVDTAKAIFLQGLERLRKGNFKPLLCQNFESLPGTAKEDAPKWISFVVVKVTNQTIDIS